MKRALNNPIVVGLMCVFAVSTIVLNFTPPPRRKSTPQAPPPSEPTAAEASDRATTPPTSSADRTIEALENVLSSDRRSPFVPQRPKPSPDPTIPSAPALLRLTATYNQGNRWLAVINGKVVETNTTISGFRVLDIQSGRAVVIGARGQKETLEILRSPR